MQQICRNPQLCVCLLSAVFQVTEQLRAYDAVMSGTSNAAADAIVYGTCEMAPFAKAVEGSIWESLNRLSECMELGDERCNSKPYCVRTELRRDSAAPLTTVCISDMRVLDAKEDLANLTGTPYSKRLSKIADQCGKIKSSSECNSAILSAGAGGPNATRNGGSDTVVVTSGACKAASPTTAGVLLAALLGMLLLTVGV